MSWRLGGVQAPDRPEPWLSLSLLRPTLPLSFHRPGHARAQALSPFPPAPVVQVPAFTVVKQDWLRVGENLVASLCFPGAQAEGQALGAQPLL